ncbi:transcriptional regulator [Aquipseudomonas alcaligenes]|uniref:winged helix-turn-helix domain-containing protein n=1 Tax=Aquipseudomonas alcaligenes TaxID=43263 RepID=UPI0037479BEE
MTTSPAPQSSTPPEGAPTLVIRTGWADCHAHFHPAHYQLVLHRNGHEEKVDLGFSGSRLLERLLRFPGEVVPREELLAYAWSDRVVGQGSLNQQVYTLRQLLGDEKRREIIQTLPRRGYMFNPKCLNAAPQAEAEVATTSESKELPPRPPLTSAQRRLYGVVLCIGTLLCLGALVLSSIHYALFQTPVARQEHQLGKLHFTYSSPSAEGLAELLEETSAFSTRLAELAEKPAKVRFAKTAGLYEMLCTRANGSNSWLVIDETQLTQVRDQLLRGCLQ